MPYMNRKTYASPEVFLLPADLENCFMVTSGWDKYHDGGGGAYGDYDINDNDYVF